MRWKPRVDLYNKFLMFGSHDRMQPDPLEQRALLVSIAGLVVYLLLALPAGLGLISSGAGAVKIEAAVLNMGARIWACEPPWPDPMRSENIAFLYGPLAPAVLGGAWLASGGVWMVPRLVSLASVLLTGVILGRYAARKHGTLAGIFALLAWTALQNSFAGYFYTARIDSFSNLCIILSVTTGVRWLETGRGGTAAVCAVTAALLCRQTAVIPWAVLSIAAFWTGGVRRALVYIIPPAAAFALSLLFFHYTTDGWSSRYIFSPGLHAMGWREFQWTLSRLILSPDMVCIFIFSAAGIAIAPVLWIVIAIPMFILSVVHASRWSALPVSLAPGIAFMVPIAAAGASYVFEKRMPLIAQGCLLVLFPAAFFFGPALDWVPGGLAAGAAARATATNQTMEAVRQHPGRVLVDGFQEYAMIAGQKEIDDIHSALGPDTAGDPALQFVIDNIVNLRYSIVIVSTSDLEAQADDVECSRPDTALRLRGVAGAIRAHYKKSDDWHGAAECWLRKEQ